MMRFLACLLALAATASAEWKLAIPLGLDQFMPIPEHNPLTAEKVALGRELFFDKRLSNDRSLACAGCHLPDNAFTDEKPVAVGVFGRKGNRRTPSLLNRAYGRAFFWDGRIATLEEQVLQPVIHPKEMDLSLDDAVDRLRPKVSNAQELSHALASYVRTILAGDSPYDRYIAGAADALNQQERLGLEIFRGKGGCTACHIGPNLTDEDFHNTGVGYIEDQFLDPGRYTVTNLDEDRGAFKTPTLRNVAQLGPFMHDGSLATLADVVEHYVQGGIENPHLDPDIEPVELTNKEKHALIEFLESLTGPVAEGL
jgi:cytochrome c peroxidase